MRTLRNFNTNTTTTTNTNTTSTTPQGQHSPWHSPVPYLFGGLAAMLGLIAFALLILACSYWKLSGYLDGDSGDRDTNDSSPETNSSDGGEAVKPPPVFEEKMLVIMAGQLKPTFIATPVCSRAFSFNDGNTTSNKEETTSSDKVEDGKREGCVQVEMGSMENHGGANQGH